MNTDLLTTIVAYNLEFSPRDLAKWAQLSRHHNVEVKKSMARAMRRLRTKEKERLTYYHRISLNEMRIVPEEYIGTIRIHCLLARRCSICRGNYWGGIKKWGIVAHDECLRRIEINLFYWKEQLRGVDANLVQHCVPYNTRIGWRGYVKRQFAYSTILFENPHRMVPPSWVMGTMRHSDHPRMLEARERYDMRKNDPHVIHKEEIERKRKLASEEAKKNERKRKRELTNALLDMYAQSEANKSWRAFTRGMDDEEREWIRRATQFATNVEEMQRFIEEDYRSEEQRQVEEAERLAKAAYRQKRRQERVCAAVSDAAPHVAGKHCTFHCCRNHCPKVGCVQHLPRVESN
jgi:hypothetical protein